MDAEKRAKQTVIRKLHHKKNPWAKHAYWAKGRCRRNGAYFGKYKYEMSVQDFKFIWFRDKAYEMQQPSIDRINNEIGYILSNCRFIELNLNQRLGRATQIQSQLMEKDARIEVLENQLRCYSDSFLSDFSKPLNDRIKVLENALAESEANLNQRVLCYCGNIEQLEKKIKEKDSQIEKLLSCEDKRLLEQIKEKDSRIADLESQQGETMLLGGANIALNKRIDALEKALLEAKAEAIQLRPSLSNQRVTLQEQQIQTQRCEAKIMRSQIAGLEKELEEANKRINHLSSEVKCKVEVIHNELDKNDALKAEVTNLQAELKETDDGWKKSAVNNARLNMEATKLRADLAECLKLAECVDPYPAIKKCVEKALAQGEK